MLVGRRVRLVPIDERHSAFIYELFVDPLAAGRIRFHGATPSPEEVAATLWDSVVAQFVVESVASAEPLGLVVLSAANFVDGFCHFSAVAAPAHHRSGLVMDAAIGAITYAFSSWPLRKVYIDVLEPNLAQFGGTLHRLAHCEARLRQHQFWDGEFVDLLKFAIYASEWGDATRGLRVAGGWMEIGLNRQDQSGV